MKSEISNQENAEKIKMTFPPLRPPPSPLLITVASCDIQM